MVGVSADVDGIRPDDPVVWHDVECADYTADLEAWRSLAAEWGSPVLDLGCGTGRVALDLAARGIPIVGVDADPALVEALARRAAARELPVEALAADVRRLSLPERRFPLVVAPMQVVQLLGGAPGRAALLDAVRPAIAPGGVLAVALADPFEGLSPEASEPPLPDMREEAGWVFSSTPTAVRFEATGGVAIDRVRQAVSPAGELFETPNTIVLDLLGADELEAEGRARGYEVLGRRRVPETPSYVGSTVVLLAVPA